MDYEGAYPMPARGKGPPSDLIHRGVRQRTKKLRELKVLLRMSPRHESTASNDVQDIQVDLASYATASGNAVDAFSQETQAELNRAQEWVEEMLTYHSKLLSREQLTQLLHSGVQKELMGAKNRWTEMESLYMMLTVPSVPDAKQRLHRTILMAHEQKLPERFDDIRSNARERYNTQQRVSKLDDDMDDIRIKLVEQSRDNKVDHFACAVPLASMTSRSDVHDENEGACPICQNSYTDLSFNSVDDLIADYPVRIKHCGHIIGKACLERWMSTPKIDQAKYPHRTCPFCRVKIEGIAAPAAPKSLHAHLKADRRAIETLKELMYGWDMEVLECIETITKNMSEEITCEEVLKLIRSLPEKARQGYEREAKLLQDKMERLKAERWAWGLKGDRVWMQLRNEWMDSGVVRKV